MAVLAGWDSELAWLVRTRGAELKRYGYLLCGDPAEAEDLVQDALVRTFTRSLRSDVDNVEQYVRRVMLNLFLDRARRRQRWQRLLPLAVTPSHAPPPADDEHGLRKALLELSPRQRACVVLHYYLDLSVEQVSHELGLGPGTVKRHLYDARARLAERLRDPNDSLSEPNDMTTPGGGRAPH